MQDLGIETINFVFDKFQIDEQWSVRTDRGFQWWAGSLMQEIWAEEPFEDQGIELCRIHARTDLLTEFPVGPEALERLSILASFSTLSGFVPADKPSNDLRVASSVYVHENNLQWMREIFCWSAIIQAIEAHISAPAMSRLFGCSPLNTEHPESGAREEMDDILNLMEQLVRPAGKGPCQWLGWELDQADRLLNNPPCIAAFSDENGLTAEYPFGEDTSLIEVTSLENPRMGNGLLMTLKLPLQNGACEDTPTPMDLNWSELENSTYSPFLGSWCTSPEGLLTFVSFLPNILHRPGILTNLLIGMVLRARFVTENIFGLDMNEHMMAAFEKKMKLFGQLDSE